MFLMAVIFVKMTRGQGGCECERDDRIEFQDYNIFSHDHPRRPTVIFTIRKGKIVCMLDGINNRNLPTTL